MLRGRDVPFLVRLRDGIDDAAVPAVEALGLHEDHDEAYPAMALHPIPDDVGGSTVRAISRSGRRSTRAGLEDHVAVVSAGFGMPIDSARRLVPVEEAGVPGIAMHVGYLGDRPVATSMGYTASGTVGVYNVATLESRARVRRGRDAAGRRGRGIARGLGRDPPVEHHGPAGLRGRIGFLEVLAFRVFLDDRPA